MMVSDKYHLSSISMPSYTLDSPSRLIRAPSNLRPVMRWKPWGVTVISLSTMWKVWVVSHHLSAKVCTKMALADLLGNKWMIGSKPATRIWPLVSLVRALHHAATLLVLPLPENKAEIYKEKRKR